MSEPIETLNRPPSRWGNAVLIAALFGAWIVLQIWVFPRSVNRP